MKGYYQFDGKMAAVADSRMNNDTVKKFWNSFCLTEGYLDLQSGESCRFQMGEIRLPQLPDGKEYALSVTESGAAVVGKDYGGLLRRVSFEGNTYADCGWSKSQIEI